MHYKNEIIKHNYNMPLQTNYKSIKYTYPMFITCYFYSSYSNSLNFKSSYFPGKLIPLSELGRSSIQIWSKYQVLKEAKSLFMLKYQKRNRTQSQNITFCRDSYTLIGIPQVEEVMAGTGRGRSSIKDELLSLE